MCACTYLAPCSYMCVSLLVVIAVIKHLQLASHKHVIMDMELAPRCHMVLITVQTIFEAWAYWILELRCSRLRISDKDGDDNGDDNGDDETEGDADTQ